IRVVPDPDEPGIAPNLEIRFQLMRLTAPGIRNPYEQGVARELGIEVGISGIEVSDDAVRIAEPSTIYFRHGSGSFRSRRPRLASGHQRHGKDPRERPSRINSHHR